MAFSYIGTRLSMIAEVLLKGKNIMKKAMNQSLATSILNGISILTIVFLVYSLISYNHVSSQLSDARAERYELTYNANRFMNGSSYLTNEVRAFAATSAQEHYDNYWNEVNNLKNRDLGVAAMQEIGITEEEQGMINEMSSISNNLIPLEEAAMKEVQEGRKEEALTYVYGPEYNTAITQINALKEQFLKDLDERTMREIDKLDQSAKTIEVRMIFALGIVVVMQLLNMIVVRWKILRPVLAIKKQAVEISHGNLSADFSLSSDTSEIGRLIEAIHETKRELKKYIQDINSKLNEMAQGKMDLVIGNDYRGEFQPIQKAMSQILDSLNTALLQINITAEQVSEESKQMASDAEILSSGAVAQASAVQQLSASIQEISGQVDSTSGDANSAREASIDAEVLLKSCSQKMEELTSAMADISKSSQQIGGIIKTIEDISFQTNILALNAAVEAARAGEAGKGFAVVAEEVKNLANKSSVSAKNITDLIEESMQLVEHGALLSADTTKSLAEGVAGAQKSTQIVERIAESATLQSQSLKQLTQGMEQISEVVQTNAATAEKSALAAKQLYNQSEELKISVQRFQLRRR